MKINQEIICALLLACSGSAFAVLGGAPMATQADAVQMKEGVRVAGAAGFSVHELQLPSGTAVREYVSPDNQVFALAWQGPFMPDMQALLGSYFRHYAKATERIHAGRRPVNIQNPDMVMHAGGHQRAFHGHAYLPGRLPPGVTLDDIQ
jgi:hypothetical protein